MACAESGVLDLFGAAVPLTSVPPGAQRAFAALPTEVAASFLRFAYRDLKNNPLAASVVVDIYERSLKSEFPISEWIAQINHVYAWLADRGRRGRLSDIVEYVSCAFEGTASQPGTTVEWFLTNFGFARGAPLEG